MATAQDASLLRVRPADRGDVATIAVLLRELGYNVGEAAIAPLLCETLPRTDMAVFLAVGNAAQNGDTLGLIALSRRPQFQLGGIVVSIDTLVVRADMRGRGVGRRLMRRARAYARLHRAVRIEVHTTRARENYRRGFYPANGFREADSALFRLDTIAPTVRYDGAGGDNSTGERGER